MSTKQKLLTFLKRFWILIVFALAVVYGVFVIISQQTQLNEAKKRNEELTAQMDELEDKYSDLESELEHAGSEEYSMNAARENLGWVKDDELVFKEDAEPSPSAQKEE